MSFPSVDSLIENSSLIVSHFGKWPSFHDAEIVDLHLWRGDVKPGADWDDRNALPTLTMKILILRVSQSPYVDRPDVVATLRFHDIEDVEIRGFNHINMIVDWTITVDDRGTRPSGEKLPPFLNVSIMRGFGLEGSFRCFRIEVLDAVLKLAAEDGP
jgi:hypothetical protein